MTYGAALVIIAVCVGITVILSAPLLYLAHRRRTKRAVKGERVTASVPKAELPSLLAYVLVMFFGFAHAYIAPNTWFGLLMSTDTGRLMFLVLPALIVVAVRVGWLNFRRSRNNTEQ